MLKEISIEAQDKVIIRRTNGPESIPITKTGEALLSKLTLSQINLSDGIFAEEIGNAITDQADHLLMSHLQQPLAKSLLDQREVLVEKAKMTCEIPLNFFTQIHTTEAKVNSYYDNTPLSSRVALRLLGRAFSNNDALEISKVAIPIREGILPMMLQLHPIKNSIDIADMMEQYVEFLVGPGARGILKDLRAHKAPDIQIKPWDELLTQLNKYDKLESEDRRDNKAVFTWKWISEKFNKGLILMGEINVENNYRLSGFFILPDPES